jgi:hypothetical protein
LTTIQNHRQNYNFVYSAYYVLNSRQEGKSSGQNFIKHYPIQSTFCQVGIKYLNVTQPPGKSCDLAYGQRFSLFRSKCWDVSQFQS